MFRPSLITYLTAFSLLLGSTLLMAQPAWADRDDKHSHGHGRKHGHAEKRHGRDDDDDYQAYDYNRRPVVIVTDDRNRILDYQRHYATAHCPPGLAKKHNGCLPPGHARRYVIGQPLPPTVVYQPVQPDLLGQLQPVPTGYQYVQVDQDILLIGEASRKVIDAVTLLSAVGR